MVWLIGLALLLVAAAVIFWQLRYPSYSYRFRMTVEVETPDGVKSGSSVYEVAARREPKLLPEMNSRSSSLRGEAVAIDLPDGRTLFALLKTNAHWGGMEGLSMNALHPDFPGTRYDLVGVAKELASHKYPGLKQVAPADYPMLVTFTDIADPTSVALVDPGDLATTFGDGFTLKRITVELTHDPVTTGIEQRLEWLPKHVGSLVRRPTDVPIGNMPVEHRLNRTDFRSGASQ